MRTLYTFDKHNYSDDMEVFERFAVRAVIIRDGKLAMQQAGEGYYKILGGASMQARPTRLRWHGRCARRQGFLSCRKASGSVARS